MDICKYVIPIWILGGFIMPQHGSRIKPFEYDKTYNKSNV